VSIWYRAVDLEIADGVASPTHHEVVLYRVAQEAIANIYRHANARRVKVALFEERTHVVLVVGDDRRGFDPAAKRSRMSFGLTGMAERVSLAGGRLSVHSAPGRGTVVTALIPAAAPRDGRKHPGPRGRRPPGRTRGAARG
jgi:signal transduction histidine kinase